MGEVGVEIEGYQLTSTPVVFGEEDVYLLGSMTMEGLGLAPDVVKKKLVPVEAFLMQCSIFSGRMGKGLKHVRILRC